MRIPEHSFLNENNDLMAHKTRINDTAKNNNDLARHFASFRRRRPRRKIIIHEGIVMVVVNGFLWMTEHKLHNGFATGRLYGWHSYSLII